MDGNLRILRILLRIKNLVILIRQFILQDISKGKFCKPR